MYYFIKNGFSYWDFDFVQHVPIEIRLLTCPVATTLQKAGFFFFLSSLCVLPDKSPESS